jgi:hypothetical protein
MTFIKSSYLLFIWPLLTACADYRFQKQDNPFSQYGINSLSIPLFYNQSSFSNVSSAFTKEVYQIMTGFKGLKVTHGKGASDAVLIGIISSPASLKDSALATDLRSAKTVLGQNFAKNRNDFYVPSRNNLRLSLKIIVIKHPTDEEIKLLQSGLLDRPFVSSKIIFSENVSVESSYTREIFADEASQVIQTQNRGAQKRTLNEMALNAAVNFRDMILYAF